MYADRNIGERDLIKRPSQEERPALCTSVVMLLDKACYSFQLPTWQSVQTHILPQQLGLLHVADAIIVHHFLSTIFPS